MATNISWHMRGDVMEACSCETTCPCNFASDPTKVPCEAIVGWRIQEGHYGEIRLDDLNVVLYVTIPGNMFAGGWTLGVYLDQRANPQQLEALGSIFSGKAGGWPAALTGLIAHPLTPKQVPINFDTANGEYHITVPGLLEVETEKVPSPMPGQPALDPKVSDLAVPFYTGEVRVRRSRTLKLTDRNMSFEYAGLSSLIGRFEYTGP